MPLLKSKSKKAFKENVKTEMEAHPDKKDRSKNLAIAYSVQRKAMGKHRKMAKGGDVLTAEDRKHIASKNFAGPDKSYPIEDRTHARNALARVSQNGSPELKAKVRAKVHAKYPSMMADGGMATTKELYDMNEDGTPNESKDHYMNESEAAPYDYDLEDSMANKVMKNRMRMAKGGSVGMDGMYTDAENYSASMNHGLDLDKDINENDRYNMDNQSMSIAERVRRKSEMTPHMLAEGGTVEIDDEGYTRPGRDEGGSVHEHDNGMSDILMNGAPQPRVYDQRNHAMMKENFNKPIADASYPIEAHVSQDDDLEEDNDDSVIERIKRKLRSHRM